MLGRPEWDHWFVLEASRAGITAREIKNKMAFHIRHKQRWTASESNKMATRQAIKSNSADMDEGSQQAQPYGQRLHRTGMHRLAYGPVPADYPARTGA